MRVLCTANTGETLTSRSLVIGNSVRTRFSLELDRICTVYGMMDWQGVLHYLVIGMAGGYPSWYPAELFSVRDHLLPTEWYFRYVGQEDGLRAIWGYKELVESTEHYDALIEMEPEALNVFVKRMSEAETGSQDR